MAIWVVFSFTALPSTCTCTCIQRLIMALPCITKLVIHVPYILIVNSFLKNNFVLISLQRYLNFTDDLTEIEFSWKESERAFKLYKEKQVSARTKSLLVEFIEIHLFYGLLPCYMYLYNLLV